MGINSEIFHISTEEQYRWAQSTLNQQSRPPLMLRLIMSAFEAYRRAKKFGWSRSWNKNNVNNFLSFKLRPMEDRQLLDMASKVIARYISSASDEAKEFCKDLLQDRNLMGFIFVHEIDDNGDRYEGATLSLGRLNGRRHRDRLDIIVESRIEGNQSQGLTRLRIYVDPFRASDKSVLAEILDSNPNNHDVISLFETVCTSVKLWTPELGRHWSHWTIGYIDYFGPRKWQTTNSLFQTEMPTVDDPPLTERKKTA